MPRKFTVFVQPRAERDMESAYEWLLQNAPEFADRWFNGLFESFKVLEVFPSRFPLAPENRFGVFDSEVRQLIYGQGFWKYRILFIVTGNKVHIVHVRHGARRWIGEPDEDSSSDT
jgi:plasmid stabilization system protein ParE